MRRILQPILAVALGLAVGLGITWLAGENPWRVLQILTRGAFGTGYDFGMTLFYTTPLIFTGLSVAIAFNAGLFNIGAEGQLTMGALAAAAVGAVWPSVPWPLAPMFAALAAILAGTCWGAIPGWLRARRGSHEVINTIMLNFVAAGLASYVAVYLLKNPDSQNPETRPVGAGYLIHQFAIFGGAPVSLALPLAIAAAAAIWVLLWRTPEFASSPCRSRADWPGAWASRKFWATPEISGWDSRPNTDFSALRWPCWGEASPWVWWRPRCCSALCTKARRTWTWKPNT
jgi:simple sugar transport system permease protein